ncbi:H-type small acid-soluble spore protein [Gracilibacillus salinarum]|uniref:Small, acid-soluble spore protein H n=1 Tax=Gracilibacillus salinarum TaxID=2932255 RepID=A0ABY4GNX0_9BACI|nr:H-type small acid-soluble spore protein [Gracilibacillus salinarum]UOQ86068.1 H-type small acid-soluble spore protein [Gracilibacillus salinarum]
MNAQRAQEIMDSKDMCHVTCKGNQVYIEHVDQGTGNATVHELNKPEQKYMVSVDELMEQ